MGTHLRLIFLQDHKRYRQGGGRCECWEKHYYELIDNSQSLVHTLKVEDGTLIYSTILEDEATLFEKLKHNKPLPFM
jgi:hypothetical protein